MTGELNPPMRARTEERLQSAFGHIEHREKRAFLRRYALTGRKKQSARDVGIHPDTPWSPAWRNDPEFQEALEVARLMAGDLLEEEMIRRGVEGVERVQFDRRSGEPLRDPRWCERCEGAREAHVLTPTGERGPAPQLDCDGFIPAVYIEREFSDRLLEKALEGHLPERYRQRLDIRASIAKLDFRLLPDSAIARIAAGEPTEAVLASILEAGGHDAQEVLAALPSGAGGEDVSGVFREGGGQTVQEADP